MRRVRICLIIPTLDQGGAEKQLCLLAAGLPRDQFDVHVVVLTRLGPRLAELEAAGVPIHFIGKSHKLDPASAVRLYRKLRSLQPDIVHTWIFAANCYGRAAAKLAGVPKIVAGERCVDSWKTGRHFIFDRVLAKSTDAILTNSTGVVEFYRQHGLPAGLFHVIPNGIPPRTACSITSDEARRRLDIPSDRILIGAVGRLWPQKRYHDMICAADLLGVVEPRITLVIIGDGPQRDELLRYRDQVTDPRWVRFVGSRQDVAELLPHFQVFWMTSEYEGQSNSLLEAMQVGLPIVATDIPGNRDLIVPDESGILVPLGDSAGMAKETYHLLGEPQRAVSLGAAAKARVERHFTVENMVAQHAAFYQRLYDERADDSTGLARQMRKPSRESE